MKLYISFVLIVSILALIALKVLIVSDIVAYGFDELNCVNCVRIRFNYVHVVYCFRVGCMDLFWF